MGHWTPTGVEPKDYDDDDDAVHYVCLDCGLTRDIYTAQIFVL